MTEKGRRDFCIECRKETEYLLQKKDIVKNIRDKEYTFAITVAVCAECGEEMSLPGLIDKNVQEIDEQYRVAEGLVSIDDIERLMKIYKIGKAPLSLALGFGEVLFQGAVGSIEINVGPAVTLAPPQEVPVGEEARVAGFHIGVHPFGHNGLGAVGVNVHPAQILPLEVPAQAH